MFLSLVAVEPHVLPRPCRKKGIQLSRMLEDSFSQGRLFWKTSARVPRPLVLAATGTATVESVTVERYRLLWLLFERHYPNGSWHDVGV